MACAQVPLKGGALRGRSPSCDNILCCNQRGTKGPIQIAALPACRLLTCAKSQALRGQRTHLQENGRQDSRAYLAAIETGPWRALAICGGLGSGPASGRRVCYHGQGVVVPAELCAASARAICRPAVGLHEPALQQAGGLSGSHCREPLLCRALGFIADSRCSCLFLRQTLATQIYHYAWPDEAIVIHA